MNGIELYQEGRDTFSNSRILLENLVVFAQIFTGSVALSVIQLYGWPLLSFGYAGFVAIMLGVVLRKHLCSSCYYYGKKCHCGWGKLSSAFFKKNSGNYKLGGILGNITWLLVFLLPLVGFVIVMLVDRSGLTDTTSWALGCFVVLSISNGLWHKKSCTTCKMRWICPGSAAKRPNKAMEK